MDGKKKKSNPLTDNFFERDIDPKVASRVDKIMTGDTSGKNDGPTPKPTPNERIQPASGAPLLPSDKLPDEVKEADPKVKKDTPKPRPAKNAGTYNEVKGNREAVDLDDPNTEKAVEDIVRAESDRMLAIEDAKAELLNEGSAEIVNDGTWSRIKQALSNLWSYTAVKVFTVLFVLLALAGIAAYPDSRYFILNKLGVRASSSMTILDEKTKQPLKDVDVTLADQTAKTDKEGYVQFSEIKLGRTDLTVKKPAFAPVTKAVTIGWGSNPLSDVDLVSVGSRYTFELVDFLSGRPIVDAEAVSGVASAVADEKGTIELAIENSDEREIEIEIRSVNYRSEKFVMPVGGGKQKIELVPSRKHAFISKRDGKFDLFTIDADGKNLKKVLPGTGFERESSLVLFSHPSKDVVALVSTRRNVYSGNGNLLSTLTIVNLANDDTANAGESESFQLIDFIGDKLVYIREKNEVADDAPDRYLLMSYDIELHEEKMLASANYFNDTIVAEGLIYYSPAAFEDDKKAGLFSINPGGNDKQTVIAKEAWNFFRAEYGKLHIAFSDEWYEYDLGSKQLNRLDGAPANERSRIYVGSPDGQKSLWVDERDGKGALLLLDHASGKDRVLRSEGGLRYPVRWLDGDHVVYRISTGSETADYIISISGGEPKKIQDVTDTIGLDRYYYY